MRQATARFRHGTVVGLPVPDVALAAALCAVAAASVLTGNPDEGPAAITLPVAVATTLALSWRRRLPALGVGVMIIAGLLQTMLAQPPGSLWSLIVYVLAIYSVATWSSEAVAAISGAVFIAALLLEERIDNGVDYVFILLVFGGVWLLGRASRTWRGRVSAAERRQQEAAHLAAVEERLRIARDLHDVIAHSLGAIAVQSDAAEAALQAAPEKAVEPVRAIRETARGALAEIRQMLELLREDGPDSVTGNEFGIGALKVLVSSARTLGTPIGFTVEGVDDPMPPGVGRAVYRIVQESLTNVARHAPGAVTTVGVLGTRREIVVHVVNGPGGRPTPTVGGGYGIRGMRERVHARGGRFAAGPTADGGFEVRAVFPMTGDGSVVP